MHLTRLYTAPDGHSRVECRTLPFQRRNDVLWSAPLPITGVVYRERGGEYEVGWRPAPRRQYVVNLSGGVYGVRDGTHVAQQPGDVLLLEDTEGSGHTSEPVDGGLRRFLFLTLDDAAGIAPGHGPEGRLVRLYNTPDGESHLEDVPIGEHALFGSGGRPQPARSVAFRWRFGAYASTWHPSPSRHYVVYLKGGFFIEASDGDSRRLAEGDVLLLEDTEGRGHRGGSLDGRPNQTAWIAL